MEKNIESSDDQLNPQFWDNQYKNQTTGWDLGMVSTPIKGYIDQLSDKNIRILIPGCGNAYEAGYLVQQGFRDITLIDIAPSLVHELREKFRDHPQIKIVLADFFELQGQFDLILEQTFFCALHPELRSEYRDKMHSLLSPSGKLVGLLFDKDFEKAGPPFGGSKKEYEQLFKDYFELLTIEKSYNSISKRLDSELFVIFKKK